MNWKSEQSLFTLTIVISALPVLLYRFFPTMDGAAHLYNSQLILELLQGNAFLEDFVKLNPEWVPNWLGHFLLAIFNFLLPAWLAEKVVLLIYVILLPLSFRAMLGSFQQTHLSFFIFPFIYTFLFYLGFYNLSLAFILFFYTVSYWRRCENKFHWRPMVVLFLLISLCYFSHILIFSYLGMLLFLLWLSEMLTARPKKLPHFHFKQILALALASLPALILFVMFFMKRQFQDSQDSLPVAELWQWILDFRPLIALSYGPEGKLTRWLFYLSLLLTIFSVLRRIVNYRDRNDDYKGSPLRLFFKSSDVFLLSALISLYLYFKIPNGSGAGMMSDRYALLFLILWVCWLALQQYPRWLKAFSAALILVVNTGLIWRYVGATKNLSHEASLIYSAAAKLEANSIVLPVNRSENWLAPHFSNYLGADKPLLILENYEAHTGWFPVIWNDVQFPNVLFGGLSDSQSCLYWKSRESSSDSRLIDYILIYGRGNMDEQCEQQLDETLIKFYDKLPTADPYIQLYRLKS